MGGLKKVEVFGYPSIIVFVPRVYLWLRYGLVSGHLKSIANLNYKLPSAFIMRIVYNIG
jgi:hypothetical protein